MLPVLKAAAKQPAGPEGVREVVGRRLALYPQPDRSDGEWAAWWADYVEALEDVPWGALEAAMAAYVREPDSEFMPKPGRLRDLARNVVCRSVLAYTRALYASYEPLPSPEGRAVEPEPVAPRVTPEEVAEILKSYRAKIAERADTSPKPAMPSTAGKADAGGLTKAMRDLMAQRGEAR